jgi:PHD/YefM family antitoxin component YafN of YafNO toxin-antitoxin module
MENTITMSRLNQNGSAAVQMAKEHGQVAITDHGATVAFILSADKVEGLLDTLEVMADPEAMQAIKDYNAGKLKMKDVGCLDE